VHSSNAIATHIIVVDGNDDVTYAYFPAALCGATSNEKVHDNVEPALLKIYSDASRLA
jgi:hypothetical protein